MCTETRKEKVIRTPNISTSTKRFNYGNGYTEFTTHIKFVFVLSTGTRVLRKLYR